MADREPYKWITVKGKHIPVYKDEHGDDVFGNGHEDLKTEMEVVDLIAGKDNAYNKDIEMKAIRSTVQKLWSQKQKLENERSKLYKDLENEKYISDETRELAKDSGMTDRDLMRYGLADITEKGYQIKSRIKELDEELNGVQSRWEYATEKLKEKQHANYLDQFQKYNTRTNSTVNLPTQETYQGFKTAESTTPYIDDMLKSGKAFVVEMSPKEYLQEVAYKIFDTSIERTSHGVNFMQVNKYAQMMREGVKFDTPYLNYESKQQEGRHRATAAMLLGIEKIPVIIRRRR